MAGQSNGSSGGSIWNLLHIGVIVAQGLWVFAWTVLTRDIDQVRHEIESVSKDANRDFLRKTESAEYRQRVETQVNKAEGEINRIRDSLKRTHDTYITREAYLGRHESLIQDIVRLNGRLDEIRKDFGSTYTLNDKIKELQSEIKDLETTVHRSASGVRDNPNTPKTDK